MINIRKKASIFLAICLLSAVACALVPKTLKPTQSADGNWHIKLFNDTQKPVNYMIHDIFWDITKGKELNGTLALGESKTFDLLPTENHGGGRIYLSDQAITHDPDVEPNLQDPYSLIEYSIGFTPDDKTPYTDYDVSAVDYIYGGLTFATEAVLNGKSDGWAGIISNDPSIVDKLSKDIEAFTIATGWPSFISNNVPVPTKIPGAYNLFASTALTASAATMQQNLLSRWLFWETGNPGQICQDGSPAVMERDKQSCLDFANTVQSLKPQSPANAQDLMNVYGFVGNYNESQYPNNSFLVKSLLQGLSYVNGVMDTNKDHLYPAYDSLYCLNPYVTFIHNEKYLNLGIYAFSIDDTRGNIFVPGVQDLYVDIGSLNNLPNKTPYPITPPPPPTPDFYLDYAESWSNTKITVGGKSVVVPPTGDSGNIGFSRSDFDKSNTLQLVINKNLGTKNTSLVFQATITMSGTPQKPILAKSNCVFNGYTDTTCSDGVHDPVGQQLFMDNSYPTPDFKPTIQVGKPPGT